MKKQVPFVLFCVRRGVNFIGITKPARKGGKWVITLHAVEEVEHFLGKTYQEAEDKARRYLQ